MDFILLGVSKRYMLLEVGELELDFWQGLLIGGELQK